MLDPALKEFFNERKEGWLKKNLKPSMEDTEKAQLEIDGEEVFAAANWLPNAAKRAGQISISTHPCTFSHPSSRKNKNGYASSIIANASMSKDGFLRSGNVTVEADALGNAAALDVYKFLTTRLHDGQTLLEHLQQDTEEAKAALAIKSPTEEQSYSTLKQGFMTMLASNGEVVTSSKIKQVYFPVSPNNGTMNYHQLSILTPSGIVFDLRKRLDSLRFGDEVKANRENKRNNRPGDSYKEIYGLATIGYGGTKPQNISVLNNQNGGKAHLFTALPPVIEKRDIQFPSKDIFGQNIRYGWCRNTFNQLHTLYKKEDTNRHVRAARDDFYQDLIDYILETLWQVRGVKEQFIPTNSNLSKHQRIWLQVQKAPDDDEWLDDILAQVANFIFHGYEKILKSKAEMLGEGELKQMRKIVEENRELLR